MRRATSPDNENTDRPDPEPRRCESHAFDPALYRHPAPALRHHQDTVHHVSHGKAKPATPIQTRQSTNNADHSAKCIVHASSLVSLEHIQCHAMAFRSSVDSGEAVAGRTKTVMRQEDH